MNSDDADPPVGLAGSSQGDYAPAGQAWRGRTQSERSPAAHAQTREPWSAPLSDAGTALAASINQRHAWMIAANCRDHCTPAKARSDFALLTGAHPVASRRWPSVFPRGGPFNQGPGLTQQVADDVRGL